MSSIVKKEPLEGTCTHFVFKFSSLHIKIHVHVRVVTSENIFHFKLIFFFTDSKLTQLDFSIPKAPVSVLVQSGVRKVEPSSKRKELSTDDIDSKDQCATQ